jgi:hypothetical protein
VASVITQKNLPGLWPVFLTLYFQPVGLNMIYCEKSEFGQISRSFSLNSGAIRLKRPKNLTQIGFPSLRSVKSDRLLAHRSVFPAGPGHDQHVALHEGDFIQRSCAA